MNMLYHNLLFQLFAICMHILKNYFLFLCFGSKQVFEHVIACVYLLWGVINACLNIQLPTPHTLTLNANYSCRIFCTTFCTMLYFVEEKLHDLIQLCILFCFEQSDFLK